MICHIVTSLWDVSPWPSYTALVYSKRCCLWVFTIHFLWCVHGVVWAAASFCCLTTSFYLWRGGGVLFMLFFVRNYSIWYIKYFCQILHDPFNNHPFQFLPAQLFVCALSVLHGSHWLIALSQWTWAPGLPDYRVYFWRHSYIFIFLIWCDS